MVKPDDPKYPVIVETANGRLRGFKQREVCEFLGVPYGTAERWQKPSPIETWKGIVNCMTLGDICPRFSGYKTLDDNFQPRPFVNMSENCLNLNIFTKTLEKDAKKPVVFYCHGGGFNDGAAMAQWSYDQEATANYGDVVAVALNHRLNIFGYLDCSRYGAEYANSGNCGQADIVLALKWVHDNIESFGGDPANVTIYGQSGGGGKVTSIMQTPEADGLYHKVIAMSGIIEGMPNDQKEGYSEKVIHALMKELNTNDFNDVVQLSSEDLLDLARKAAADPSNGITMRDWSPVKNDWFLGDARSAGFTEYGKKVPMIIGSCIAEFIASYKAENKDSLSEAEREEIVRKNCLPGTSDALIEAWRKTWSDKNLVGALAFGGMRLGVLEYAEKRISDSCSAPTWVYLFAHNFKWKGGSLAWHSSDIPFLFHNLALYPNLDDGVDSKRLEDQMSQCLYHFAHKGNPNNDSLNTDWTSYTKENHATMILDTKCEVKKDFDQEVNEARKSAGIKGPFD